MARMNWKKVAITGGAVVGGILILNKVFAPKAKASEVSPETAEKVKEQVAQKESTPNILNTIMEDERVRAKIDEVGTKATGYVKDLMGKLGVDVSKIL